MFTGHWKEKLSPKYHTFCGNYHHKPDLSNFHRFGFDHTSMDEFKPVLMLTPPGDKKDDFYLPDEYAKHVIGLVSDACCVLFALVWFFPDSFFISKFTAALGIFDSSGRNLAW